MFLKIIDNRFYVIFMEPTTSHNEKEARQGTPYVLLFLNSFQYQFSHYSILV